MTPKAIQDLKDTAKHLQDISYYLRATGNHSKVYDLVHYANRIDETIGQVGETGLLNLIRILEDES